jgi:hypothetical protein
MTLIADAGGARDCDQRCLGRGTRARMRFGCHIAKESVGRTTSTTNSKASAQSGIRDRRPREHYKGLGTPARPNPRTSTFNRQHVEPAGHIAEDDRVVAEHVADIA